MSLLYEWADIGAARKFTKEVMSQCTTCQACSMPTSLKGLVEPTPIPSRAMVSVALDMFDMPATSYEGSKYDAMLVCVDRHSGWVVALPCSKKGFNGAKAAKLMLWKAWRPFGIPSIITSDLGSHFVSLGGPQCAVAWAFDKLTPKPIIIRPMGGQRLQVSN